ALTKATKGAVPIQLVKGVKFKGKVLPKSWRDIAKHVDLEWAVGVKEETTSLLPLADCRGLARSVVQNRFPGAHIISAKRKAKNGKNGKNGKSGLVVTRSVAKSILKHIKAEPPRPLASVALLRAALGALEEAAGCGCLWGNERELCSKVILDARIQEFFDGPEMGIIRAKEVPPPERLAGCLRPYQLTGYHWLVNNARNGLGCILADDMGLGKTLQAISLLLYMKQNGLLERPMLVVVPKGVLTTWSRELAHWAGDELSVHVYFGNKRCLPHMAAPAVPEPLRRRARGKQPEPELPAPKPRKRKAAAAVSTADVFLTSYGVCRSDAARLACPDTFGGMILDEAQQIKNYNSQISKAVKMVAEQVGPVRVALTGTPVENRMADLHSQFEFILPGYLASSRQEFEKDFGKPLAAVAKGAQHPAYFEQQTLLRRIVAPFILRRSKTDPKVAGDLPPKIEQTHECELSTAQQKLYLQAQEAFQDLPSRDDKFRRCGHILKMLQAFREICNHPACLADSRRPEQVHVKPTEVEASGKCSKLQELLTTIFESGEKALIFSNSLVAIDMLCAQIRGRFNCEPLKIVGSMSTEQREAAMSAFQTNPACPLIILSLQAGGVGLTLTAATHVIHFDRQYNPAKENQATDRAHRIGQKKTVCVHRLVSKDTFEERLGQIMEQKQRLSDLTMAGGRGWIADLDDRQLRDLFSLKSS
ncbi:unnamed protein product, partial [Effrenium voratum]